MEGPSGGVIFEDKKRALGKKMWAVTLKSKMFYDVYKPAQGGMSSLNFLKISFLAIVL